MSVYNSNNRSNDFTKQFKRNDSFEDTLYDLTPGLPNFHLTQRRIEKEEGRRKRLQSYTSDFETGMKSLGEQKSEVAEDYFERLELYANNQLDPSTPTYKKFTTDMKSIIVPYTDGLDDMSQMSQMPNYESWMGINSMAAQLRYSGSKGLVEHLKTFLTDSTGSSEDRRSLAFQLEDFEVQVKKGGASLEDKSAGIMTGYAGFGMGVATAPFLGVEDELGYHMFQEDSPLHRLVFDEDETWVRNKSLRKAVARFILDDKTDLGKGFQRIGLTPYDIMSAPSISGMVTRLNQRRVAYNAGQAGAHMDWFGNKGWQFIKDLGVGIITDPDTVFEVTATVIAAVALPFVGAGGAAAYWTARVGAKGAAATVRAKRAHQFFKAVEKAGMATQKTLRGTGKYIQATRKLATVTSWVDEIIIPFSKNIKNMRVTHADDVVQAATAASKANMKGTVFGTALKRALLEDSPFSWRGRLIGSMGDGAIGELMAYGVSRDSEYEIMRLIYGDSISREDFDFNIKDALGAAGAGAGFGVLMGFGFAGVGEAIKGGNTWMNWVNESMGKTNQTFWDYYTENLKEIKLEKDRAHAIKGFRQSIGMDQIADSVSQMQGLLIRQGNKDVDSLENAKNLVEYAFGAGVDLVTLTKNVGDDPTKLAAEIKKLANKETAIKRRRAIRRVQAALHIKDKDMLNVIFRATDLSQTLNEAVINQAIEEDKLPTEVDSLKILRTLAEGIPEVDEVLPAPANVQRRIKRDKKRAKNIQEDAKALLESVTKIANDKADVVTQVLASINIESIPSAMGLQLVNAALAGNDMKPLTMEEFSKAQADIRKRRMDIHTKQEEVKANVLKYYDSSNAAIAQRLIQDIKEGSVDKVLAILSAASSARRRAIMALISPENLAILFKSKSTSSTPTVDTKPVEAPSTGEPTPATGPEDAADTAEGGEPPADVETVSPPVAPAEPPRAESKDFFEILADAVDPGKDSGDSMLIVSRKEMMKNYINYVIDTRDPDKVIEEIAEYIAVIRNSVESPSQKGEVDAELGSILNELLSEDDVLLVQEAAQSISESDATVHADMEATARAKEKLRKDIEEAEKSLETLRTQKDAENLAWENDKKLRKGGAADSLKGTKAELEAKIQDYESGFKMKRISRDALRKKLYDYEVDAAIEKASNDLDALKTAEVPATKTEGKPTRLSEAETLVRENAKDLTGPTGNRASVSLLQRELAIPYSEATQLIQDLVKEGVLSKGPESSVYWDVIPKAEAASEAPKVNVKDPKVRANKGRKDSIRRSDEAIKSNDPAKMNQELWKIDRRTKEYGSHWSPEERAEMAAIRANLNTRVKASGFVPHEVPSVNSPYSSGSQYIEVSAWEAISIEEAISRGIYPDEATARADIEKGNGSFVGEVIEVGGRSADKTKNSNTKIKGIEVDAELSGKDATTEAPTETLREQSSRSKLTMQDEREQTLQGLYEAAESNRESERTDRNITNSLTEVIADNNTETPTDAIGIVAAHDTNTTTFSASTMVKNVRKALSGESKKFLSGDEGGTEVDNDARNIEAVYTPEQMIARTLKQLDEFTSKLDPEKVNEVSEVAGKEFDEALGAANNNRKAMTALFLDTFGIDLGMMVGEDYLSTKWEGGSSVSRKEARKKEFRLFYQTLRVYQELGDSIIQEASVQIDLARQLFEGTRAVGLKVAESGINPKYVPIRLAIHAVPSGKEDLLYSIFGSAERKSSDGEIFWDIDEMRSIAEERYARADKSIAAILITKMDGKRRDAQGRDPIGGRVENLALRSHIASYNRVSFELLIATGEAEFGGDIHKQRVKDAADSLGHDEDDLVALHRKAAIRGVVDGWSNIVPGMDKTNLARRLGIAGLVEMNKDMYKQGHPELDELREELYNRIELALQNAIDDPSFNLASLYDGSIDSASGYHVGRAAVEALDSSRSIGRESGNAFDSEGTVALDMGVDGTPIRRSGYIGTLGSKTLASLHEDAAKEEVARYVLFSDEDKTAIRTLSPEEVQNVFSYYREIKDALELGDKRGWDQEYTEKFTATYLQDTYFNPNKSRTLAPDIMIRSIKDKIGTFEERVERRVKAMKNAPPALVKTLHDELAGPQSFLGSLFIVGNAPGEDALVNGSYGDIGFNGGAVVPMSVKDAINVRAGNMFGSVKGLAKISRHVGLTHMAEFLESLSDKGKGRFIEALHDSKVLEFEDNGTTLKIINESDASAQAVTFAKTIHKDYQVFKGNAPESTMTFLAYLNDVRDKTVDEWGGKQMSNFMENYLSSKGEDNYSLVGMHGLKKATNTGWVTLFNRFKEGLGDQASELDVEGNDITFKTGDTPVGNFIRSDIFKPPVMTKPYAAGRSAFRTSISKGLEEIKRNPEKYGFTIEDANKFDVKSMAHEMTGLLYGLNKNDPGLIESVLDIPDSATLREELQLVNTLTIKIDEKTSVEIRPEDITNGKIHTDPLYRQALRAAAVEHALMSKDSNMLALEDVGEFVIKQLLERKHGNLTDGQFKQTMESVQQFMLLDPEERGHWMAVSSYISTAEHTAQMGYLADSAQVRHAMETVGVEPSHLSPEAYAAFKFGVAHYYRKNTGFARAFSALDSTIGVRDINSANITKETIGVGEVQLGQYNLADGKQGLMGQDISKLDSVEYDNALRSAVVLDMIIESSGIFKPPVLSGNSYSSPALHDFTLSAADKTSVKARNSIRETAQALPGKLDELERKAIEARKAGNKPEDVMNEEEIRRWGFLEEMKKILIQRDEDTGRIDSIRNDTWIGSSIQAKLRVDRPNPKDVGSSAELSLPPTKIGVPLLRSIREMIHSGDVSFADKIESEYSETPFTVAELNTASPISIDYLRDLRNQDMEVDDFVDEATLRGEIGEVVTEAMLLAEVTVENQVAAEENTSVRSIRAERIQRRLLGLRASIKRILTAEEISDNEKSSTLAVVDLENLRKLVDGLVATFGGTSEKDALERGGMAKLNIPQKGTVRGRANETVLGAIQHYGADNLIGRLVGLALGPAPHSNVRLLNPDKDSREPNISRFQDTNRVPKVTPRGPMSIFFRDWQILGGSHMDAARRMVLYVYKNHTKDDGTEFNSYEEAANFVNKEGIFSVWESITTAGLREDADKFLKKLSDFVVEESNLERHGFVLSADQATRIQDQFDRAFESSVAQHGLNQRTMMELDGESRMVFMTMVENLQDPVMAAYFKKILQIPDDFSATPDEFAVRVAVMFLEPEKRDNILFLPVYEIQRDEDGLFESVPTTWGDVINGMYAMDQSTSKGSLPVWTELEILNMVNATGNREVIRSIMLANRFNIEVDTSLTNSSRLDASRDKFANNAHPIHGFLNKPRTDENADTVVDKTGGYKGYDAETHGLYILAKLGDDIKLAENVHSAPPAAFGIAALLSASGILRRDLTTDVLEKAVKELRGDLEVTVTDVRNAGTALRVIFAKKKNNEIAAKNLAKSIEETQRVIDETGQHQNKELQQYNSKKDRVVARILSNGERSLKGRAYKTTEEAYKDAPRHEETQGRKVDLVYTNVHTFVWVWRERGEAMRNMVAGKVTSNVPKETPGFGEELVGSSPAQPPVISDRLVDAGPDPELDPADGNVGAGPDPGSDPSDGNVGAGPDPGFTSSSSKPSVDKPKISNEHLDEVIIRLENQLKSRGREASPDSGIAAKIRGHIKDLKDQGVDRRNPRMKLIEELEILFNSDPSAQGDEGVFRTNRRSRIEELRRQIAAEKTETPDSNIFDEDGSVGSGPDTGEANAFGESLFGDDSQTDVGLETVRYNIDDLPSDTGRKPLFSDTAFRLGSASDKAHGDAYVEGLRGLDNPSIINNMIGLFEMLTGRAKDSDPENAMTSAEAIALIEYALVDDEGLTRSAMFSGSTIEYSLDGELEVTLNFDAKQVRAKMTGLREIREAAINYGDPDMPGIPAAAYMLIHEMSHIVVDKFRSVTADNVEGGTDASKKLMGEKNTIINQLKNIFVREFLSQRGRVQFFDALTQTGFSAQKITNLRALFAGQSKIFSVDMEDGRGSQDYTADAIAKLLEDSSNDPNKMVRIKRGISWSKKNMVQADLDNKTRNEAIADIDNLITEAVAHWLTMVLFRRRSMDKAQETKVDRRTDYDIKLEDSSREGLSYLAEQIFTVVTNMRDKALRIGGFKNKKVKKGPSPVSRQAYEGQGDETITPLGGSQKDQNLAEAAGGLYVHLDQTSIDFKDEKTSYGESLKLTNRLLEFVRDTTRQMEESDPSQLDGYKYTPGRYIRRADGEVVTRESQESLLVDLNEQIRVTATSTPEWFALIKARERIQESLTAMDSGYTDARYKELHDKSRGILDEEAASDEEVEDVLSGRMNLLSIEEQQEFKRLTTYRILSQIRVKPINSIANGLTYMTSIGQATSGGIYFVRGSRFGSIRALGSMLNPDGVNTATSLKGYVPAQVSQDSFEQMLSKTRDSLSRLQTFMTKLEKKHGSDNSNVEYVAFKNDLLRMLEATGSRAEANLKKFLEEQTTFKFKPKLIKDVLDYRAAMFNKGGILRRLITAAETAGTISTKVAEKRRRVPLLPFALDRAYLDNPENFSHVMEDVRKDLIKNQLKNIKEDKDISISIKLLEEVGILWHENKPDYDKNIEISDVAYGNVAWSAKYRAVMDRILMSNDIGEKPADFSSYGDTQKYEWVQNRIKEIILNPREENAQSFWKGEGSNLLDIFVHLLEKDEALPWSFNKEKSGLNGSKTPSQVMAEEAASAKRARLGRDTSGSQATLRKVNTIGSSTAYNLVQKWRLGGSLDSEVQHYSDPRFMSPEDKESKDWYAFRENNIFTLNSSLFGGRLSEDWHTQVNQHAYGVNNFNIRDMINTLRDAVNKGEPVPGEDGSLAIIKQADVKEFLDALQHLEDQYDVGLNRVPQGVQAPRGATKFMHTLARFGVTLMSAPRWAITSMAETVQLLAKTIGRIFLADFAAPLDFLAPLTPNGRRRLRDEVNLSNYHLNKHNIGVRTGVYWQNEVDEAEKKVEGQMIGPSRVDNMLRMVAVAGFQKVNRYNRMVAANRAIRDIRKAVNKEGFKDFIKAADAGDLDRKQLMKLARKSGLDPKVAISFVQSGVGSNIKPETFTYIVNNYMDSLGVDWDKLYAKANQLRMDGKVTQANTVVTAAQQMFGTLQLLNTGVNVEPRMLTAQVVKNPLQELLGALGQFPALALHQAKQAMYYGGITGLMSTIIPFLLGEVFLTIINDWVKGKSIASMARDWKEQPVVEAMKIAERLPYIGSIGNQVLPSITTGTITAARLMFSSPDFLKGYMARSGANGGVGIAGFNMLGRSVMDLSRGIDKMSQGKLAEGAERLYGVTPLPFYQPATLALRSLSGTNILTQDADRWRGRGGSGRGSFGPGGRGGLSNQSMSEAMRSNSSMAKYLQDVINKPTLDESLGESDGMFEGMKEAMTEAEQVSTEDAALPNFLDEVGPMMDELNKAPQAKESIGSPDATKQAPTTAREASWVSSQAREAQTLKEASWVSSQGSKGRAKPEKAPTKPEIVPDKETSQGASEGLSEKLDQGGPSGPLADKLSTRSKKK